MTIARSPTAAAAVPTFVDRAVGHSAAALVLATMSLACNVGAYQGPDRPEDSEVRGPPPPADFHCDQGERRLEDTDHDGRPDRVVHVLGNGSVVCSTEDKNHDGKVDTWNRIVDGRVIERASDTDFDGTLDVRSRGDGVAPASPQVVGDAGAK